jgi:hypothetical protein
LKVDDPQVGQQHEDVERKWEYNPIIIFPEIDKKEENKCTP